MLAVANGPGTGSDVFIRVWLASRNLSALCEPTDLIAALIPQTHSRTYKHASTHNESGDTHTHSLTHAHTNTHKHNGSNVLLAGPSDRQKCPRLVMQNRWRRDPEITGAQNETEHGCTSQQCKRRLNLPVWLLCYILPVLCLVAVLHTVPVFFSLPPCFPLTGDWLQFHGV